MHDLPLVISVRERPANSLSESDAEAPEKKGAPSGLSERDLNQHLEVLANRTLSDGDLSGLNRLFNDIVWIQFSRNGEKINRLYKVVYSSAKDRPVIAKLFCQEKRQTPRAYLNKLKFTYHKKLAFFQRKVLKRTIADSASLLKKEAYFVDRINHRLKIQTTDREKLRYRIVTGLRNVGSDWHKNVLSQLAFKSREELTAENWQSLFDRPKEYENLPPEQMEPLYELIETIPSIEDIEQAQPPQPSPVFPGQPSPAAVNIPSYNAEITSERTRTWIERVSKLTRYEFAPDSDIGTTPDGEFIDKERYLNLLRQTQNTLQSRLTELRKTQAGIEQAHSQSKAGVRKNITVSEQSIQAQPPQDPGIVLSHRKKPRKAQADFSDVKSDLITNNEQIEDINNALSLIQTAP